MLGTMLALSLSVPAQELTGKPVFESPQLKPSDPLSTLNTAFRTAYADLRSGVMKQTGPVIIQCGDKMVLIKDGVRTEAPALTRRYHELKSVAHVPLALYVMLVSGAGEHLGDAKLSRLRDYRTLVVKARDSMEARGFAANQRDRQLRILDRSLELIDATVRDGNVTADRLRDFARSQREDLLANAHAAAEDQIDTMDRQFKAWQAGMSTEERKRLRVAVGSVHMARVGNLAMQYFAAALNEPSEGRFEEEEIHNSDFRLLFTESVFDEKEIVKAIATHVVDSGIGNSFFGDSQRMHRDLLADPAEEIIRKKFGRQPAAATKHRSRPEVH